MLPSLFSDVTHCEKNRVLFSKQGGLPRWRQASKYMFKNSFHLIKVKIFNFSFFWRHVKTKNLLFFFQALAMLERIIWKDPKTNLQEGLLFNLCTIYELESSYSSQKKQKLLDLVAKHRGDGFNISCLKIAWHFTLRPALALSLSRKATLGYEQC